MQFGDSFIDALLRWCHILSGITWIGILYYFNFINGAVVATMDAETKKKVVPELMWRCLWWFRWAAMSTLVFGLLLFLFHFFQTEQYSALGLDGGLNARAKAIMWGMLFGVIMWFNVWFMIWPRQKQILPCIARGEAPPAGMPQKAAFFSKMNTYFSGPMLMLMIYAGGDHAGAFDYGFLGIALVVGFGFIHVLFKVVAPKIGTPAT